MAVVARCVPAALMRRNCGVPSCGHRRWKSGIAAPNVMMNVVTCVVACVVYAAECESHELTEKTLCVTIYLLFGTCGLKWRQQEQHHV